MNWSSLSGDQRIRIILEMIGGPKFREEMAAAAKTTNVLGKQIDLAGKSAIKAARGTFLWNQMIYTMRRYTFYGTLAITAMIAEVVRLGFTYNSTMQKARTSLLPFFGNDSRSLQHNLNQLFLLAAKTPFQFQDVTKAFAAMYTSMQPLGVSAKAVRDTLLGLSNALVVAQRFTPQALNRASVALQKMGYQGRLTGRVIQQLGSDGIPIYAILNKELGLTRDRLNNISSLNIPAGSVLDAINKYLLGDPRYAGQAMRSQLRTLSGAFSTFKDLLSQGAGSATRGPFQGLTRMFRQIDLAMLGFAQRGKPITLTEFVRAVDKVLSPKTHLIINFFVLLTGVLRGFVFALHVASKALNVFLWPFRELSHLLGGSGRGGQEVAIGALGFVGGILLFATALRKTIALVKELTVALRVEAAVEAGTAIAGGLGGFFRRTRVFRAPVGGELRTEAYSMLFVNPVLRWIAATRIGQLVGLRFTAMLASLRLIAAETAVAITGLTLATVAWVAALAAVIAALTWIFTHRNQIRSYVQRPGGPGSPPNPIHHPGMFAEWGSAIASIGAKMGTIIPQFDVGGKVPGPIGRPQLAIVHGGEHIANPMRGQSLGGNDIYLTAVVEVDGKKMAQQVFKYKQRQDGSN